jgi:hypothetical protein
MQFGGPNRIFPRLPRISADRASDQKTHVHTRLFRLSIRVVRRNPKSVNNSHDLDIFTIGTMYDLVLQENIFVYLLSIQFGGGPKRFFLAFAGRDSEYSATKNARRYHQALVEPTLVLSIPFFTLRVFFECVKLWLMHSLRLALQFS